MTFQRMTGDPAWIRALIDGPWDDERFLTIKPGEQIVARYDGTLVGAEAS